MTEEEYRAAPGLSQSALKDLAVSPLRFYHKQIRPDREPEEPTPYMIFGSAVGCALLEGPEAFLNRYAQWASAEDYPGCLVTIADIRAWIQGKGMAPKGTKKEDVINQALAIDPAVPILEVIEKRNAARNAGKQMLSKEDWVRVGTAVDALMEEPKIRTILESGSPEVPMFRMDPETGVLLKAKMDWVKPNLIMDVKTFTQKRGKSIDQSVADAIFYERYHWQAYFYSKVRGLAENGWKGDFVIALVESEEPHEVRIKALRPDNLYWNTARFEVNQLIELYADCINRFGESPWRDAQLVGLLQDEDIPQLAY